MEIKRPQRTFVSSDFELNSWDDLKAYYDNLTDCTFHNQSDFDRWLKDRSELEAVIEENAAWRYIRMTIDTTDEKLAESYRFFTAEIQPQLAPYEDRLNKKMMESPYLSEYQSEAHQIYFRSVQKSIEMFREENIPLQSEISDLTQEYGAITGKQSINYEGQELTMQQAAQKLKDQDPEVREKVFRLISERRMQDRQQLDELFDKLIQKRHQVALNAGYENYRDYKFDELGRFDYTKEDCFDFHASIKKHVVPLAKLQHEERARALGKEKLLPWDTEVDPLGRKALKPFDGATELVERTINIFGKISPYYGDCIQTMSGMKHLDLESKPGKAPGGYNYPLYEIGVPFIFMNSVGSQRDLVTMVHEGGHAIHSFLSRELELTSFKSLPSEVAELASMSMELLSMGYWDQFYADREELNRAKKDHLESIISVLPWIAMVDEFQHWIYSNPKHTALDRKQKWEALGKDYGTGMVDWTGWEEVKAYSWHRQLHIFEVPFYYIEYGIAQLGAISVWRNSQNDFSKAIKAYEEALKLGYSKSIPQIYETAAIRFDFSDQYVSKLADFVSSELKELQ
ncbi:MAG: M3 family oligoendopeptidase [Bacteroidetes bacterium]|nr:MAG: M3 family oligoendopeptidase [Bacteroidota bacterium]